MAADNIGDGKLSIALISDEPGWHSEQLIDSFARRSCTVRVVPLQQCHITSRGKVYLPGFEDKLPHGVFVRGVPAGSLDTVTFYLDVLHALAYLGVLVYNDATMIERSVDKGMTSFLLSLGGVATPLAWSFPDWDKAGEVVATQLQNKGRKLVLKPVFGSQGKGLELIRDLRGWQSVRACNRDNERVCYLQSFVESEEGGDMRTLVVGGRVVAAMGRIGESWINNVARGAKCVGVDCTDEMTEVSQMAVEQLGIFYAGVDLIRDANGKLWVIEVNSIPAWKGLQSICDINIADCLADDFLAKVAV